MHRFEDRDVLIYGGVVGTMLFRLLLFPLPGGDHPPTKDDTSRADPSAAMSLVNFLRAISFAQDVSPRNVDCASSSGGESYCAHEWCDSQPAINLGQYITSSCLVAATNAFCMGMVQTLFNKILGPKPQVN